MIVKGTRRQVTWYSPSTVLGGLLSGGALAVLPLDAAFLFAVPLSAAGITWAFYRSRAAGISQLAIVALVLIAAALAPVKAMDEVLLRPIQLPVRRLSLAELAAATGAESSFRCEQQWSISWNLEGVDSALVVELPSERLTAGEFIGALEAQTPLRHHFAHCGNAYSVLRGQHASTMVSFRKPHSW